MSKLDNIKLWAGMEDGGAVGYVTLSDSAKQAIKDLMLEVIGEAKDYATDKCDSEQLTASGAFYMDEKLIELIEEL